MKLEPDYEVTLTVEEARALVQEINGNDAVSGALDEAQGDVYTEKKRASRILITIEG